MIIDAHTKLYCILGNPVRHSLSPAMHNAAFDVHNINAVYLAFQPTSVEHAVSAIRELGIAGCSITIPYKVEIMRYLDQIDPLASNIGSVNTIVVSEKTLTGYNTDGYGALMAMENGNVAIKSRSVLILGNGGSARAIAFTLLQAGANITIAGRNIEKITALTDDLQAKYNYVDAVLLSELKRDRMDRYSVIINTTPIGMHPDEDVAPLEEDLLLSTHTVFDIIYSPDMTKLLVLAQKAGCKLLKGVDMLIYQGIKQFELWTGRKAPYDTIRNVVAAQLVK